MPFLDRSFFPVLREFLCATVWVGKLSMKKKIFILFFIAIIAFSILFKTKISDSIDTFISKKSNESSIELQGNIEVRESRLSFLVSGRISKLYVDEGDEIKKGTLLAELEPEYYEDAVKQIKALVDSKTALLSKLENGSRTEEIEFAKESAESVKVALENAKKDLYRSEKLFKKGALSEQQFDDVKTTYKKLDAQLKVANANLSLVKIGPRIEDINAAKASLKQASSQ